MMKVNQILHQLFARYVSYCYPHVHYQHSSEQSLGELLIYKGFCFS